ncbi:sugar-binding transcriptional regulator [Labrys monachus]|uniref:DNA-binding transcriptional regulator LsrR (DeoR family) n=1 Tax=Labrys monachus TaxID=217067 RepID=A0ABU0FLT3_9HYPH|nr:sugar-binding domain-containing protein [Labrys monachus]MDQ0395481.1 DNA-binding transcriptional regulator LsrR (DeoR family) [Labrys monachus]
MADDLARHARDEDDEGMPARAAWMHFVGGMTHAEVGKRLHVPGFKVQRLIAQATREGMVQVFVNSPIAGCARLEQALSNAFGLEECIVAPDIGEAALVPVSLAAAGAQYLLRILQSGAHRVIGLGHGRTLTDIVERLPRLHVPETSFVALLGGLTTSFSADPFDVIHRISDRTKAAGFFLPVPFFANSSADREVLLSQLGVVRVQALALEATLLLVGIGTTNPDGFLARNGSLQADDLVELKRLRARGEILTYFHDAQGRPIRTEISSRAVTLPYEDLAGRNIVAAAGGADKVDAIRSILRSGLLKGLITDEATAAALLGPAVPERQAAGMRTAQTRRAGQGRAAAAKPRRRGVAARPDGSPP